MLRPLCSTLFRLCAFGFFVFVCASMHTLAFGHAKYSIKNFGTLTAYLTFLVLVLQTIYYLLAAPLQLMRFKTFHGILFCVTFTLGLLVCLMFWALFLYDQRFLVSEQSEKIFPNWFNHAAHTAGICSNIIDVLLWKPSSVPFFPSLMLLSAFSAGYIYFLEHLIRVQNFYAYPILNAFSEHGRFAFYAVTVLLSLLCFFLAYGFIGLFTRNTKSKSKGLSTANRTAATQAAGKQKKLQKAD